MSSFPWGVGGLSAWFADVAENRFPKLSKDTIKDTLGHVASREGAHTDKKWVLKD